MARTQVALRRSEENRCTRGGGGVENCRYLLSDLALLDSG